jgi:hypothetical protein
MHEKILSNLSLQNRETGEAIPPSDWGLLDRPGLDTLHCLISGGSQ